MNTNTELQEKRKRNAERSKNWYHNNKEKAKAGQKRSREKRKEINKVRIKEYRENNKNAVRKQNREYISKRMKEDESFKLSRLLRSRLCKAIKRAQKSGSAVRDLGCTIDFLKSYLESKFTEGMSWNNWSKSGWHIDHVIPLNTFDLTNPEQFKKAVHYTNLQPLWAVDNLRKRKGGM